MISGKATPEGTAAYAKKHPKAHERHWRPALGLTVSSLGMGTYLGNADPVTDGRYAAAAEKALESGINVLDSAINYRYQRSERNLGAALRKAVAAGTVTREQVLVCTKGGFISGDMGPPSKEWFQDTYLKPGIVTEADFVGGGHCMTPKYLRFELDQSRRNLDVETIDVYYVHNPETQAAQVGETEFYARLTAAFRELEACVAEGKIQVYGVATWHAYRVPPRTQNYMSLEKTIACARDAGGEQHHFRVVQLPLNLGLPEAMTLTNQSSGGTEASAIDAAGKAGLAVFTSVPLMQGQLLGRFGPEFRTKFPGLKTDAQRCLQFVRSTPGVTAPLCGMKDLAHVEENTAVSAIAPFTPAEFGVLTGR
ncbi:MAG TPA: aldo/keto reductase [Planctomycetota bacterium]|nr:aldo/keto reductase [Planctomycetota bacterium]